LVKDGYSPFWGEKNLKRASKGSHEGNKLCILDETKQRNMIMKILAFCISLRLDEKLEAR